MPDLFDRFRDIIWTSVIAVAVAVVAAVTAIGGASIEVVAGLGFVSTTLAILSLQR